MLQQLAARAGIMLALAHVAFPSTALEALPTPTGPVVLTISGIIDATNVDGSAQFDLKMLSQLEPVTLETSTIWTEGKTTFVGVPLQVLLERVGARGTTLAASALNEYTVQIPGSDAVKGGPIVAYEMNGEQIPVRGKGPLWIVYPYDMDKTYQSEVVYARSIWQLSRIEVKP